MSDLIIASLTYGAIIVAAGIGIGWLIGLGIICIDKALAQVVDARKRSFIMNKLTFIGVVHHELAHAITFFLTGAKIVRIELFKPDRRSGHLGEVEVIPRGSIFQKSVQRTLGAVAPVFFGIADIALLMSIVKNYELFDWLEAFIYYVMLSIFIHMELSPADVKIAIKGLPITYTLLVIVVFIYRLVTMYLVG